MATSNETPLRGTSARRTPRRRSAFKNNRKLKAEARASLLGNLTTPVISVLMYLLITSILTETITFSSRAHVVLRLLFSVIVFIVVGICAKLLQFGLSCIFLKLNLRQAVRPGDLFYAFRVNSDTAVVLSAMLALPELLSMLPVIIAFSVFSAQDRSAHAVLLILLFIAGIIGTAAVRLCLSLCSYLFLDFPGLPARTLFKGGAKMIRGHRVRLFRLYLSFFPQYLLSALSFGVAGLWVMSYTRAAEAAFYRDLTAKIHRKA